MWKEIIVAFVVIVLMYIWITLPAEKCCGREKYIPQATRAVWYRPAVLPTPFGDTLESVLHGDLSSRTCENKLVYPTPKYTDLKASRNCFESNQLRGLIDSSPEQGMVCKMIPNCSRYMWAGDMVYPLGMPYAKNE